jgi:hypothetical protein
MTISAQTMAFSAGSHLSRAARCLWPAALLLVLTAMPAEARPTGAYDGTWNVVFATQRGNCSATNSVPFAVSGSRVSSAGGGQVTGGIGHGGVVSVAIRVGASHASGTGRLSRNFGAGRWSGIITGDRCSGSWQATRN